MPPRPQTSVLDRALRSRALVWTLSAGVPAAVFAAPTLAHAGGSCATAADVSSDIWNETPPLVKNAIANTGPFGASAIKAIKMIDEGIKIWNKLSGNKSWAKIGPRRLDFGEWNTGTLIGPTERMFLSGIPAVNPVKVDFHKLDHEGKVKVVICKKPQKGKAKAVKTFTVEAGAKNGKVKSVIIDDAKGHVISVVLHGKSVAKKLKYKVRAKMIYDQKELDAEHKGEVYTAPRTAGDDGKTVSAPRTQGNNNTVSAPRG